MLLLVHSKIFCVHLCSFVFLPSLSLSQGTPEAVEDVGAMLVVKLPVFIQSGDLEVQERACCILQVSDHFTTQPLFLRVKPNALAVNCIVYEMLFIL